MNPTALQSTLQSPLEAAPDYVRGLPPYVPGRPASEVNRELKVEAPVMMASNENPLGASPRVIEAMTRALIGVATYPDNNGFDLKAALQRKFGLAPERLVLGNGSSELIDLAARTFLRAGDEAIYSQFAFISYPRALKLVNAKAVCVPARDHGHDLEAMRNAITPATRLIFVANPNNPTGTRHDEAALRAFFAVVPRHVLVVLDEAYTEYQAPEDRLDSFALIDEFPNLVVLRTFSKAYGLAGQRVGYLVARPEMAELINRTRPAFNVNVLALCAAEAALADDEFLERTYRTNRDGRVQLGAGFDKLGLPYIRSWGNFLTFDLAGTGQEAADVCDLLMREGYILRPLGPYGMKTFLRVTVGTPAQNAGFLEALGRVLTRRDPS